MAKGQSDMDMMIETDRLLLRPTRLEDLDGWAELMGDAEASRFIGGPVSRADSWRGLMTMAGSWALQGFAMFSMIDKESGRWIGRTGPWQPEGWPGTEVGWGVIRAAQARGYAYEAAVASIDWAFDKLGWTEIIHCIDPANTPSQKLAQRLGSTHRGRGKLPAPFEHFPVEVWGQTREQWRNRPREAL
jgi:RimJ/RimL family protein N-acetyltransferase